MSPAGKTNCREKEIASLAVRKEILNLFLVAMVEVAVAVFGPR